MKNLLFAVTLSFIFLYASSQTCSPAGDQFSYGSNNTWIGYIYDNPNFTNYMGYLNEGNNSNPNFDENFSGDFVNKSTNGCTFFTETFSARFKLTKNFAAGTYRFTVGADDGYRLSLDGGATWVINKWMDDGYATLAYTATLSGPVNMVFEYYENSGFNRVSFDLQQLCAVTGSETAYGINGVWNGYIYTGTSFNQFMGHTTEGIAGNPNFDEDFGGAATTYTTDQCNIFTDYFSARYKLQSLLLGSYLFTVSGDDGYRLSLDGGTTWIINQWNNHTYNTSTYNISLNGTVNMVLEYYENTGTNRLTFSLINSLLPVKLLSFYGNTAGNTIQLSWQAIPASNSTWYQVEKSEDGKNFTAIERISAGNANGTVRNYGYTDAYPAAGNNYYRLRMIEADSSFSFSPVIKVQFLTAGYNDLLKAFIANGFVYLKTGAVLKNAVVDLYTTGGQQIRRFNLPSLINPGQTILLGQVPSAAGAYVVVCTAGGVVKAHQVLINH